jgi:hypothetical protein
LNPPFTNSGYSSEPNTKRICKVLQVGIISNSRIHASLVASGSSAVSCGSLEDVPLQVPVEGELFGPIALVAEPVVSRIPLLIPMLVVLPLEKVP